MEDTKSDANIAVALKRIFEKTNEEITLDAVVNRALTEKITVETINQKVNAQMNAISVGVKSINPKFNEKSKNYDVTKTAILETLANYESALNELSQFYDTKIEQLILRKVELESHLLGSVIRDEYLFNKENKIKKDKENDKVKKKMSNAFMGISEKLERKKQENKVDVSLILNATDALDLKNEINTQLINRIEKTQQEEKENKSNIQKIEKEVRAIDGEIKRINERKKVNLMNAMESGEKWVVTTIRKTRTFTKITRFFSCKFNTPKLIYKTILEPLNNRIDDFVSNELANVKG